MTFETQFSLRGITTPQLDETAQTAVVTTVAYLMQVAVDSVELYKSELEEGQSGNDPTTRRQLTTQFDRPTTPPSAQWAKRTSYQPKSVPLTAVTKTDTIRQTAAPDVIDPVMRTLDVMPTVTYNIRAFTRTTIHLVDYPQYAANATSLYADLTAKLVAAVASGNFSATLHSVSQRLGSNSTLSVTVRNMTVSSLVVVAAPTFAPTFAPTVFTLSTPAVSGIVIGSILLVAMVTLAVHLYLARIKKNKAIKFPQAVDSALFNSEKDHRFDVHFESGDKSACLHHDGLLHGGCGSGSGVEHKSDGENEHRADSALHTAHNNINNNNNAMSKQPPLVSMRFNPASRVNILSNPDLVSLANRNSLRSIISSSFYQHAAGDSGGAQQRQLESNKDSNISVAFSRDYRLTHNDSKYRNNSNNSNNNSSNRFNHSEAFELELLQEYEETYRDSDRDDLELQEQGFSNRSNTHQNTSSARNNEETIEIVIQSESGSSHGGGSSSSTATDSE